MTPSTGVISGIRVSHDRASLDDVAAACHTDQQDTVARLAEEPEVSEAFVLQTCNRFEAYVVTDAPATGRTVLADFVTDVTGSAVIEMSHEESLRHLLRVAAGLESLVLGEDQIIGQVRDAYSSARAIGAVGPMLEEALTKAIHVGERARTETAINEGVVSVGSAAVTLVSDHSELAGATALVIGAGEMGTIAAHAFAEAGVETLIVANRSIERAEEVADAVYLPDTRAVGLDALPACLPRADVVITATGRDGHVLDADLLDDCGETLVVDIAQPRDVSPAVSALDDIIVHDMQALESVTDETRERRRAAAQAVEAMVDREFENLLEQYKRKRADEVIAEMYAGAEQVKERELQTALSRLESEDFDEEQRAIVESLADALVSQLLAPPTKSLRDAAANDDWTTINTALQLFDPEFRDDPPAFVAEHLESTADD
ncbi:glutamyl-tRNA reductase [Haladaptatus paucihalophilus]|uniref:Glutamyl-tRNA reductase n=1 Tax=Haladaptatus paucihalophilus DX253 TaxID=797209 RepID=A0A1M6U5B5_HALPU|nr:glutamyl-tRNA reductase [Haladaptatus paucihalophilus]SHK64366.1 glutamyl-tRNA reductase [Haladaptatus paucihalophilus DX253]